MTTICVNCRHHRYKNPYAPEVWYNHLCAAVELEATVDPVTGAAGFLDKNDLGRTYITEDRYALCRDINHGNCEYYQKKG